MMTPKLTTGLIVGSLLGLFIGQYVTLGDHFRPALRPDYDWVENVSPEIVALTIAATDTAKREHIGFEDAIKILEDGSLQKKLQGAVGK